MGPLEGSRVRSDDVRDLGLTQREHAALRGVVSAEDTPKGRRPLRS